MPQQLRLATYTPKGAVSNFPPTIQPDQRAIFNAFTRDKATNRK